MTWKPDRLLRIILLGTMVTMLFVWLPLVRGLMDGESYQWANGFWASSVKPPQHTISFVQSV